MAMRMPKVDTDFFPLIGGLDLKTHRILLKPGRARLANNYVGVLGGGYRRIGGYEPYDGHARPSQQTYEVIYADTTFATVVAGDTVNGATSGATGKVIEVGESRDYIVVTRVTGTFTVTENIRIGVTVIGAATTDQTTQIDTFDDNRLLALVEAEYRTSIAAVPGEGPVRGVVELNDVLYAFRNNVGSTACLVYKETATGWSNVSLGWTLSFNSGGTTPITEGTVIDNGLGVTATVLRVALLSGSWAAGDAVGYLVLGSLAGGNWAIGDPIEIISDNVGTATSVTAAQTLLPNGRFNFAIYNFTGSADTKRIYGADGVNKGFEFDGTVMVPIRTGMASDTPLHVCAHKNRLWFSFRGSAQFSGAGTPYVWSVILGAGEIGAGDVITGMVSVPGSSDSGGALMIFCRERIIIVYGSSVSDFTPTDYSTNVGASQYSVQKAGNAPTFMDELGITTARQSQDYGGFKSSSISTQVEPLLKGRADDVVASVTSRRDSFYILFFNDMTAMVVTFGKGGVESIMPIEYLVQPFCAWETTRNGGEVFIGAEDGFVYQLESGRSFSGEVIEAFMCSAFNHSKGPTTRKSYIRGTLEMRGQSAYTLQVTTTLSYDDPNITTPGVTSIEVAQAGGLYDVDSYDECFFDGQEQVSQKIPLRGSGINLSVTTYSNSAEELPHELQGIILHFVNRRLER